MKKIFIGDTAGHEVLYQVAKHSIETRCSSAACRPIRRTALEELGIYWRQRSEIEATDFSITRFLVPFLSGYRGWALFVDNDIVCLDSISALFDLADDRYAVMCVKHEYTPAQGRKLNNQLQTQYPRKNWSSVVLWNCGHPSNRCLSPELINEVSGLFLHRFQWLNDEEIGELPYQWNWLVGWHDQLSEKSSPSLLHFTEGGPYFSAYSDCHHADVWLDAFEELHGRSFRDSDLLD